MRLVFAIPYFHSAWQYGGTPRAAFELARGLVRRGHVVKVLTTDSAGSSRIPSSPHAHGAMNVEGIDVVYYRNLSNYLAFRHRLFLPLALFHDVRRQLSGYDIVHIHELRNTVTVAAYEAVRKVGLPFVLSPHGGLQWLGKHRAKLVFDKLWGRSILRHATRLIAVSPLEEKDARMFDVKPEQISLLPNTVFPDDYANLPESGEFRQKWQIREDKIVLFLGRMHWVKGADLLIKALAQSHASLSNVHLVIAGPDDTQERELRRMLAGTPLQQRTTFTGFLDHKAKLQALVDASVVAIPSRSEVFAIAALEALMCGTPVILSSACGIFPSPGIDSGVWRFENENIADLACRLHTTLNMDSGKSFAGREFVIREFSPGRVAERAEYIYEEAIQRG
ncbi:MAG TPA: glycosyltransferase [Terriglobia bacterium]|nr:glycosyltransferase [Terriglobia bacterium]